MKKTKRGAKRIGVMLLAVILMMESVSMPVRGEVKNGASAQTEMNGEQISENSVKKSGEETVSANFVFPEETEVSANTVTKEDDEVSAETVAIKYSGTDGDLEWSVDSEGYLVVTGKGDYEDTPDWLTYKTEIKSAYVRVQEITSTKGFFKKCSYLEDVYFEDIDTSQVTDMSEMFYGCSKLGNMDVRDFDTGQVTTMAGMFSSCSDLNHVWINGINTGNVTDMSSLFANCSNMKSIDISSFDMSQVTDLSGLFHGCSSLEQISLGKPDTVRVEDMGSMFSGCKALEEIDVSQLDTANVTSMSHMFAECESVTELDLSTFDMGKVGNTQKMFYNCSGLEKLNLGKSEMKNLSYTPEMFRGCCELQELDLSTLHTSKVVDMEGMFMECRKVKELDVSHFDTSNVRNMEKMFANCSMVKELDVSGFETGAVTDMSFMFSGCSSVKELDVSSFDMSNVYNVASMFAGCSSLTDFTFGEDKDLDEVLHAVSMFEGCRSLKSLDIDLVIVNATNINYMFKDCSSLNDVEGLYINGFNVKSARGMFQGCSNLEVVIFPFSGYNVTDISNMFKGCTSLKELVISSFRASILTSIDGLCDGCSSLTWVTLPSGEATGIERMYDVFSGCSSLEAVNLNYFKTPNVTYVSELFYNCNNLKSVEMDGLEGTKVTSMFRMFAGCSSLQSIDLSQFEPKENSFARDNFKDCTGLIEMQLTPSMMQCLAASSYHNFDGSDLFSDIFLSGTMAEWESIKPTWQNCVDRKLRYAAIHLSDGTIEQMIQHEGTFQYIKQGGFGISDEEMNNPETYVYNCDLSQFFENSYNYHHNLAQMSIRVSMAAMSNDKYTNSSNIEALMDDLNLSKKVIHYPIPEYNSIGYAMGARRIYHNNQKKTLIMVAIRGGGYGSEWGGNANVGAGENHAGFDIAANQVYVALNQYIGELKEYGFIEEGDKDIAVWISGYSRGAATANLVAAKLNDNYYMSTVMPENFVADVQSKDVFAFCFECPRNTTNEYHDHVRYNNIYNIINPKDFVTYVAMNNGVDWRFNRFGKDLLLPDEANMNEYAIYIRCMELVYQGDTVPEMKAFQSGIVKDIAKQFADLIPKNEYVMWHQEQMQPILVSVMCKQGDLLAFYEEYLKLLVNYGQTLAKFAGPQLDILLAEISLVNDEILYAHYPELCMAWMDSIPKEVLTKKKSFWNVIVNCPVDIYVYEGEKLVGCIKNDVPQQIENGVITMFDSNGQKQIVLPGDSEYKLVYKATADGTMTISTSNYIQAESIPETVTSYYELPLKAGATYESFTTESEFILTNATRTVVNPSVVQSGADVQFYKIDLSAEGNGEVSGINTYSIGEFAKVSAYPADGEQFMGWYKNGTLVNSEPEYRFCVKENTTLVAKFTDNRVAVGKCYEINKHTYKVTNVEKKTVSFVKTASRSKTIKIPATVRINGTKYKVTAIEANALKGNKKVTKVKIGSNVTSIGKKAFYKCTALKTITIPAKVKTIGESAFSGCKKLTKATLGKGVTKIGKKAFYNCKKLKAITIKSKKLKSVGKYAFKGIAKQATIKCTSKKLKKYKKMIKKSRVAKTVRFK